MSGKRKTYWYSNETTSGRYRIAPANVKGFIICLLNFAGLLLGIHSAFGLYGPVSKEAGSVLFMASLLFLMYSMAFKTDYNTGGE